MSWTEINKDTPVDDNSYHLFSSLLRRAGEHYKDANNVYLYSLNHKQNTRLFIYEDPGFSLCLGTAHKGSLLKVTTTSISEGAPLEKVVPIFFEKLSSLMKEGEFEEVYGVWNKNSSNDVLKYYKLISDYSVMEYNFLLLSKKDINNIDTMVRLKLFRR